MSNLITLYVHREWTNAYHQTTILKDSEGKIKGIIPSSLRQPRLGQKTIMLNCWQWNLNWDNVPKKYVKVKDRV